MRFAGDTVTIARPDYVPPWSGRQVIPWLAVFFFIIAIVCVACTGLPLVAVFFKLMADACWVLTLVCAAYTVLAYRYWIRYFISRDEYRCLLSPQMATWFYNRQIFSLTGINQEKCVVPLATVVGNRIQIVVLPKTLKILTDPQFATELDSYMWQHGCQVSVLPGQRRGGYVFYTIRPSLGKDRLFYEK